MLNVGIGLYSEADEYVFGYNTKMDKIKLKHKAKGSVVLKFDNLPLLHGNYYLNAVCFGDDETIPYDFKHKVLSFGVISQGLRRSYRGVLAIGHKWEQK